MCAARISISWNIFSVFFLSIERRDKRKTKQVFPVWSRTMRKAKRKRKQKNGKWKNRVPFKLTKSEKSSVFSSNLVDVGSKTTFSIVFCSFFFSHREIEEMENVNNQTKIIVQLHTAKIIRGHTAVKFNRRNVFSTNVSLIRSRHVRQIRVSLMLSNGFPIKWNSNESLT